MPVFDCTSAAMPVAAGEAGSAVALDIGCAVGGATFQLARAFPHVLGIDFSQQFVNAANVSACAALPVCQWAISMLLLFSVVS